MRDAVIDEITVRGRPQPPAVVVNLIRGFLQRLPLPRLLHFVDLVLPQMVPVCSSAQSAGSKFPGSQLIRDLSHCSHFFSADKQKPLVHSHYQCQSRRTKSALESTTPRFSIWRIWLSPLLYLATPIVVMLAARVRHCLEVVSLKAIVQENNGFDLQWKNTSTGYLAHEVHCRQREVDCGSLSVHPSRLFAHTHTWFWSCRPSDVATCDKDGGLTLNLRNENSSTFIAFKELLRGL